MALQVDILGDGLASCCVAHLISQQGFTPHLQMSSRTRPARLLLSEQTQSLLCETFNKPRLFERATKVRRRIVAWGNHPRVELPHRGVVISEQDLLCELWQQVRLSKAETAAPAWTIASMQNAAALPESWSFGSRVATSHVVELSPHAAEDCCWVESLPDGWLFLLPCGNGQGALISAGYSPASLPEQSRLIAGMISNLEAATSPAHRFQVFPQILTALGGDNWLACGSAAMTFDPLCGEGAGHAVREAILASAVIRAAAAGAPTEPLLSHYTTRLMQGFLRHLQVSLPFYLTGGDGIFWNTEAAALQKGIAWIQDQLRSAPPPRYRLSGYELQPIAV